MLLGESLFRKIGANLANDPDCAGDESEVAIAFEAYDRLVENIRRGLTGDNLDFDKVLEKCREDRRACIS